VIVFRGPHSYISPTWYNKPEAVPTWNFAVVHATGRPKPITDPKALHGLLAQLIAKFEGPDSSYDFAKLPESYINGMIGGIIGFEMRIELLEGKFKLGQERSDADKQAILKNLQAAKQRARSTNSPRNSTSAAERSRQHGHEPPAGVQHTRAAGLRQPVARA
jgi:transcriptional regulator